MIALAPSISNSVARCAPLPAFDGASLEAVQRAFAGAVACSFRQAWRDEPEADFCPGAVRMGWRENTLLVFAEFTDVDIFNAASAPNQRTWELGDVFEIFLQADGAEAYSEFHVTPDNQRLQLRYAHRGEAERARQTGGFDEMLVSAEMFRSRAWVQPDEQQWHVFAEIPSRAVGGEEAALAGSRWRFSFSRYDYTRGRAAPVLSSTSAHAAPDFHRQEEWGVMIFGGGL